jgi:hypothetical protein
MQWRPVLSRSPHFFDHAFLSIIFEHKLIMIFDHELKELFENKLEYKLGNKKVTRR